MSVRISFTDLEAGMLRRVFAMLYETYDVDYELLSTISGKIEKECKPNLRGIEKKLRVYDSYIRDKIK